MKNVEDNAEAFMADMEKRVLEDDTSQSLKTITKHREGMSKRKTTVAGKDNVILEMQSYKDKDKGKKKEVQEENQKQTTEEIDTKEEENDEEEMPEKIKLLPEDQQQAAIIKMSLKIMGMGTMWVILFSDPMVGVLSAFGDLIGVNPFYVSFVLAPLASNGSELLAA
jgi:protein subunit release factor A